MKKTLTGFILAAIVLANSSFADLTQIQLTATPSTTTINHPVHVGLSINNTGSMVTISNVQLTATSSTNPNAAARIPAAFSRFNTGPNALAITFGASATTENNIGEIIFFAPSTGITGSGSGAYAIGGSVSFTNGTTIAITNGVNATINPVPLPAYQRQ